MNGATDRLGPRASDERDPAPVEVVEVLPQ